MRRLRALGLVVASVMGALGLIDGIASPAAAQTAVVFGDSLSDTGLAGRQPSGRYSDGLNWVDKLFAPNSATGIGVTNCNSSFNNTCASPYSLVNHALPTGDVLNFATAGGYAGSGNVCCGAPGAGNGTTGTSEEVQYYLDALHKYGADPTAVASSSTLFVFFAGTNNGGYAFFNYSGAQFTAAVNYAATSEANNITALYGVGARRFLVLNLGDLSAAPGYGGAQKALDFTQQFNAELKSQMNGLASSLVGSNIIQADIHSMFKIVQNNQAAFGLAPNSFSVSCNYSGSGAVPTACKNAIYIDGLHYTEFAGSIMATYLSQLIDPTRALQQVSRMGETGIYTNGIVTDAVFDRLSAFVTGSYVGRNGPFAEALGSHMSYGASGGSPGFNARAGGIRAGYDKKFGSFLFGGSLAALTGNSSSGSTGNELSSYRADLYGTALFGNAYVSADVGVSRLDLSKIRRDTGFPTVIADGGSTSGTTATAAAEAGYVLKIGNFAVIPSGRATYYHTQLNGYAESAPILAMQFADREMDTLGFAGKVRFVAPLAANAVGFTEVGYERLVTTSSGAITASFVGNTALPTTIDGGTALSPGFQAKVGISSELAKNVFVDLKYGLSVHDEGGQTHSGDVRLKVTF